MSIVLNYTSVPSGLSTAIVFYYASTGGNVSINYSNTFFGGSYNSSILQSSTGGVNTVVSYTLSSGGLWPGGSLRVTITPLSSNITELGSTTGIQPTSNTWLNSCNITVSTLTSLSYAFVGSINFNSITISNADTSNISNFEGTFSNCFSFNTNISGWNTSSATTMKKMFENASSFNQNLGGWNINNVIYMDFMLDNSGLDSANFDSTLNGWGLAPSNPQTLVNLGAQNLTYTSAGLPGATRLVNTFNWTISGASGPLIPCFGENTKILCLKDGKEEYLPITSLRKGDFVKTAKDGYLKIDIIGKSKIYNFGGERIPDRLYLLKKDKYPQLNEDLILTGYHSILVDSLSQSERDETLKLMKRIYITGDKYRLVACLDQRAEPYVKDAFFDVYHFGLENVDYFSNYGIYANGLLVETCSKRFMKELSGMTEII